MPSTLSGIFQRARVISSPCGRADLLSGCSGSVRVDAAASTRSPRQEAAIRGGINVPLASSNGPAAHLRGATVQAICRPRQTRRRVCDVIRAAPHTLCTMDPPPPSDAAVRATNDEAFAAKVSATRAGYLRDPYALALADAGALAGAPATRQPLINRGTFARVTFVRRRVARFVAAQRSAGVQVVSLGAGFDTLPFVLMGADGGVRRYVELDFVDVVAAKATAVKGTPAVAAVFDSVRTEGAGLVADGLGGAQYCLAACDLRDMGAVRAALDDAGVSREAPTVFISECVLVYMEPAASDALLAMGAHDFSGPRAWVNYEPVRPGDPFGEQMVANIALRGSPLLGIAKYPSVDAQRARFETIGFESVEALTMLEAMAEVLNDGERERLDRLERLDEFEEFRMMMEHYCVVWAQADCVPTANGTA